MGEISIKKFKYEFKEKGMYFNSDRVLSVPEMDMLSKHFNNFNWKLLSKFHQSIHHINFYELDNGSLDSIVLKLRRTGIKPEDIDEQYLETKKRETGLSDYETLCLSLSKKNNNTFTKSEITEKIRTEKIKMNYYKNSINNLIEQREQLLNNT